MMFSPIRTALAVTLLSVTAALADPNTFVIAIHGGASPPPKGSLSPELEAAYRAALERALRAGHEVLVQGGAALDAVMQAVLVLEEEPLFNAGHGAVFTSAGTHELDASIMDGRNRSAGAVAMVTTVRNPIRLARGVMDTTPHVLMAGAGAEALADQLGLERVDNSWFTTPARRERFNRSRQFVPTDYAPQPRDPDEADAAPREGEETALVVDEGRDPRLFGTVGAVARDQHGNLAAATSTGGRSGKLPGRVGDAPLIGAGTWADNATCAVSCTGAGEYFIRANAAADVGARMAVGGRSLGAATREVIHERIGGLGGAGGMVAVDHAGTVAFEFNTRGMYRGSLDGAGNLVIELY